MEFQRLMLLVASLVFLLLVYLIHPILTPFIVAALLAYLGDPLVDRLEALKLNRTLGVCVVFLLFAIFLLVFVLITLPLVNRQIAIMIERLPHWLHDFQQLVLPKLYEMTGLEVASLDMKNLTAGVKAHWQGAGNIIAIVWQQLSGSGMALIAGLANLVLVPVVTFYLLRDWDILLARISESLPRAWLPKVVEVSRECHEILGAFIRGQLLVMLALGIIYSVGLGFVGLDLALLLGLLAGIASIVPYLGFIVGIVAASVAAYFQFHEWLPLLWVALVFGIGQVLESVLLTPWLVGDRIGLHPVAVIFAIMAGGQLAGFVGVLLALPIAAVVMVWLRHVHAHYKTTQLYHAVDN